MYCKHIHKLSFILQKHALSISIAPILYSILYYYYYLLPADRSRTGDNKMPDVHLCARPFVTFYKKLFVSFTFNFSVIATFRNFSGYINCCYNRVLSKVFLEHTVLNLSGETAIRVCLKKTPFARCVHVFGCVPVGAVQKCLSRLLLLLKFSNEQSTHSACFYIYFGIYF